MMNKAFLFGATVGLFLAATPARAHHSFDAEYDRSKSVTLRGTLIRVELTNPHGWVYLDVKGADGKVLMWAIETGPTNALIRAGLRKTDFVVGTEVVVEGFLAKNGSPTVNGRDIKFADGRDFFLGSSGTPKTADGAPAR